MTRKDITTFRDARNSWVLAPLPNRGHEIGALEIQGPCGLG